MNETGPAGRELANGGARPDRRGTVFADRPALRAHPHPRSGRLRRRWCG
ncbi:MAG: hypothetical protein MZV63_19470 [Marinilabiliales bacterium]|nr:hypothetical protein [Marinilabiliales bacterium]